MTSGLYPQMLRHIFHQFPVVRAEPEPPSELQALYHEFNGGLLWNGGLLIRSWAALDGFPLSVAAWNEETLWKHEFNGMLSGTTFFAEDTFGIQFGLRGTDIVQFDPETAQVDRVAETIEEWWAVVARDPEFLTGFRLLEAWQKVNGPLPLGFRLIPKQLFMLGGEFSPSNLVAKPDIEGMRIRGQLWRLTKDLPEGTTIKFNVV